MRIFGPLRKIIDAIGTLYLVFGWFGLSAPIASLAIAIGVGAWATMTGVAAPIVLLAAFCTVAAGVCLALVPMAYRTLRRIQDMPVQIRPDPEIWRYVTTFRLSEAACLLANIQPDLAAVSKPGDAYAWYRALCDALKNDEIKYLHTGDNLILRDGYYPHETTIIPRVDLIKFADQRHIRRAFLDN
jgi:hypothetical protein